jgi:hypothetical protein
MNVTGRASRQGPRRRGSAQSVGRRQAVLGTASPSDVVVDMARRDFFVAVSMLGGSLLVVQTLVSLFEAMARYA